MDVIDQCRTVITGYRCLHCNCRPLCQVCGFRKHAAIHMPPLDAAPDSPPWGHEYEPQRPTQRTGGE